MQDEDEIRKHLHEDLLSRRDERATNVFTVLTRYTGEAQDEELINVCNFIKSKKISFATPQPLYNTFELPHDKTNKMICAPSENSDQPGHPLCLIRVFAVA